MEQMDGMDLVQDDSQWVSQEYNEDDQSVEIMAVQECSLRLGFDYPAESNPSGEGPVAVCSFVHRFHDNSGRGAMKYQPVDCSEILESARCNELRRRRGIGTINFGFETKLAPLCQDYNRKVMTVPSIGCPKLLGDINFCERLLWG